MANEKTPLLAPPVIKHEVVIDMKYAEKIKIVDENNNINTYESLTYEQLLPYIVDEYWIRVRKICFSLYITMFIVILLAACISALYSTSSSCKVSMPPPLIMNQSDKSFTANDTNIVAALFFSQYDRS